MQNQKYKHWYYHRSNGTTSLESEVLIPLFYPYFSNAFHCFSSIVFGYFLFLIPVIPNCAGPTSLCSMRDISLWNRKYPFRVFRSHSILMVSLATFFQFCHTVLSLLSLSKIVIPLLDTCCGTHGVWHTTGNGTLHTPSLWQYTTVTYPPVTITIYTVSTLQIYAWLKRDYPLIFKYQF